MSARFEHRYLVIVHRRFERNDDRHVLLDLVIRAVDDVRHHANALFEFDHGNDRRFLEAERLRIDRKSTRLTPVTNAHLVCRLLLEQKKHTITKYKPIHSKTED